MRAFSLASGSRGNAYVLEHDGCTILIDCGISTKAVRSGLAAVGLLHPGEPLSLAGVLVTHSHVDHVSGLDVLLRHCETSVFANAMTAETVAHECHLGEESFACFENGQSFELGPFEISPFSIPHDTSDPVGYLVRAGGETYFHGTDIGTPLDAIGVKLAEADFATLESNHDPVMLRRSGRPPCVIQRIAGPRGHLSNDDACELVRRFASPRLRHLALAHLSHDCNAPHLAEGAMRATLVGMGRSDVRLTVLAQDEALEI